MRKLLKYGLVGLALLLSTPVILFLGILGMEQAIIYQNSAGARNYYAKQRIAFEPEAIALSNSGYDGYLEHWRRFYKSSGSVPPSIEGEYMVSEIEIVLTHPYLFLEYQKQLLEDKDVEDPIKQVSLIGMQLLKTKDYLEFCNYLLDLVEKRDLNYGIADRYLFPINMLNTYMVLYHDEPAVNMILIRAARLAQETYHLKDAERIRSRIIPGKTKPFLLETLEIGGEIIRTDYD